MASATKRIILSSGWQRIAQAKGREAMALINSYGSVQLAVAEGEPPRGDVASGHSLNGSMMWPVKGADIIWARGAGVAVSVTLLKVVPEFATLDSAALKVATASAQAVATAAAGAAATADAKAVTADNKATAADAKATEAQQAQARRDYARWELVDYLHPDDMAAALVADTVSQDEFRVTAAIQAFHDAFIDWWSASPRRCGKIIYPAVTLAINDEVFSEHFAQKLYGMGNPYDESRLDIEANGIVFQCKNWLTRARVRTSGFYAQQGIAYPVPTVVWRWEQVSSRQYSPQIKGRLNIAGENNIATDPIGFKGLSMNATNLDKVYVRDLYNYGIWHENLFNSSVSQLENMRCGYQPTDLGGTGFIPDAVRFSNSGAVVTATEAIFNGGHVGKWFALAGAGPMRVGARQVHWSTVASVDSATQITLTNAPDTNVTDQLASFEAVRGSISAGTNILTLSTAITDDLTGRYITIWRCGQEGTSTDFGTMTAVVTAHSGDQVTLSHNARLTVTDTAVAFATGLFLGRSAEVRLTGRGQNNDVTFDNMRLVGGDKVKAVCAILSDCDAIDFGPGSKFHGGPPNQNNFGGNFAAIMYDWVETLTLNNCLVEHSGHSPRFGRHMIGGGNIVLDLNFGTAADFMLGTESAEIFNDMQASPTSAQVYHSMIRHRGYVANQTLLRLGANGQPGQIVGGVSSRSARRGPDGRAFPVRLARNGGTTAQRPNPAFQYETYFDTSLGYNVTWNGSEWVPPQGNSQPQNIQNLDTQTAVTRTGVASASTTGAPDTLGGWLVDIRRGPGSSAVQIAHRIRLNTVPVTVIRHNNNGGGSWSAWCYPDGTTFTP